MEDNSQSRKWLLTICNPLDYDFTHEKITDICKKFMPEYFCLADEIATTGTPHTHVFLYSKAPIRFSTLKKRFPEAHIDKAYGSERENRDYIRKEGKWIDDVKAETKVENSFFEWGNLPEKESKEMKFSSLIENIDSGMRTVEIIKENPTLALKSKEVEALRQIMINEQRGSIFRKIEVNYLWGKSGTGKTRSIYENNPPHEICRITNYRNNQVIFDGYDMHNVLVFEEFHSNIPIGDMLNYLDVYPLRLPARYNDKIAMYTKVYITSNIPLDEQYKDVQRHMPEVWSAFLRRITKSLEYKENGVIVENQIRGISLSNLIEDKENPFM